MGAGTGGTCILFGNGRSVSDGLSQNNKLKHMRLRRLWTSILPRQSVIHRQHGCRTMAGANHCSLIQPKSSWISQEPLFMLPIIKSLTLVSSIHQFSDTRPRCHNRLWHLGPCWLRRLPVTCAEMLTCRLFLRYQTVACDG